MNDTAIYDIDGQYLENEEQVGLLLDFFDMFEKKFRNDEIIQMVNIAKRTRSLVNEEDASLLLPYYSPLVEDFVESNLVIQEQLRRREEMLRINSRGRDYAIKHATNPNRTDYQYFSNGNCANFACIGS